MKGFARIALVFCTVVLVPTLAACQMYETAPVQPRKSGKPLKWRIRVTDTTGTAQVVAREGGFIVVPRTARMKVSEADAIALSDRNFPRPAGASLLVAPVYLADKTPAWVVMYLGLSQYTRAPGVVQQSVGHRAIVIDARNGKIIASWTKPDATGLPLTKVTTQSPSP